MKEAFRAGGSLVFCSTPGANDVLTLRPVDGPVDPEAGGLQHFGGSVAPEDHEAEAVDAGRQGREERPYAYIKDPDGYVIELS